jgi:hypothetical protein
LTSTAFVVTDVGRIEGLPSAEIGFELREQVQALSLDHFQQIFQPISFICDGLFKLRSWSSAHHSRTQPAECEVGRLTPKPEYMSLWERNIKGSNNQRGHDPRSARMAFAPLHLHDCH